MACIETIFPTAILVIYLCLLIYVHASQTKQFYSTSKQAINTPVTKVTCAMDEISSGMDDACNGLGSCNASAMECSDNSDSESEIFRVKRRSTSSDKPTSDAQISNLSEQQVCYFFVHLEWFT